LHSSEVEKFYYYAYGELKDEIKRGKRFDAELKRIVV